MELFEQDEVDLITLEAGQGYFAGRYHSMRPIVAEKYDTCKFSRTEHIDLSISYIFLCLRTKGDVDLPLSVCPYENF